MIFKASCLVIFLAKPWAAVWRADLPKVKQFKVGADVSVEEDGLTIRPTDLVHGARLATHHDHRLAMSFGLLGLVADGIEVTDPQVVSKSWPDFWETLDALPAHRS